MQQVDHGPKVAALLDVDLEQVAQVVEARRGQPKVALLLDAGRLGVALDDDQPLQCRAELAGHLLPGRLAAMRAEADRAVRVALGQEDAPAVLGQVHVAEVRPPFPADSDSRPQIDVLGVQRRSHVVPPVQELRLPGLQRPLQPSVRR